MGIFLFLGSNENNNVIANFETQSIYFNSFSDVNYSLKICFVSKNDAHFIRHIRKKLK